MALFLLTGLSGYLLIAPAVLEAEIHHQAGSGATTGKIPETLRRPLEDASRGSVLLRESNP